MLNTKTPADYGFEQTSRGRWRGELPDGADVVITVGKKRTEPNYAHDEPWVAEAVVYSTFDTGRQTEVIGTGPSEQWAVKQAAEWAREQRGGDPGSPHGSGVDF